MAKQRTTELEIQGYFGNKHPGRDPRPYKHVVKKPDEVGLDALVQPVGGGAKIPLKSCLVETLAEVRDGTGIYPGTARGGWWTDVPGWLEWFGHLKSLYFLMEDHIRGHVIYEVTPKGHTFLAQHEAPVDW